MIRHINDLTFFLLNLYDAMLQIAVYFLACPRDRDGEDCREESKLGVYICRFFYYVLTFVAVFFLFKATNVCMEHVRNGTQPPAYIPVLYALFGFFAVSYLIKGFPYLFSRGKPYGKRRK